MRTKASPRGKDRQTAKLSTDQIEPAPEPAIIADITMLKPKLIDIAKGMGLDTTGTKAEILQRIEG